jgi:hypothetical protein
MATTNLPISTEPSKTTRRRAVLAMAIEQLATNSSRRAEMGEACGTVIEQQFDWQNEGRHVGKPNESLARRVLVDIQAQGESAIDVESNQYQFTGEKQ